MGAGKALCFDCTEEMVKESAGEIAWLRNTVKKERLWMIIGAVVGFLFIGGMLAGQGMGFGGMIFGLFIGMSLGTIFNGFMEHGAVVGFIMIIVSPIMSIVRFVKRINQIKQCDAILAEDAQILQNMRDYFEYTLTMEKSGGVSLDSLVSQGGQLFENTYARSVASKGEAAAQSELRQGAVQIAANGEIVRGMDRRIAARAAS
jgi:hypothetical protein